MATTQLSLTATPGMRYSFSAKEAAAIAVGLVTAAFTAKKPDIGYAGKHPEMTFVSKKPNIDFET